MMTTAAAVCAMPLLAFGQANTGGSSQMQTTTQTTPNQGQVSGTPAARDAATTGREFPPGGAAGATGASQAQMDRIRQNEGNTTGNDARPGATGNDARPGAASRTDGTPGNPPSTATQRAVDSVTGQRTDPDGTGNNPPGTAAGRAIDRATTDTDSTRRAAPATATGTTTGATGATGTMAVDSARLRDGRRASKVIGSTVYNESNESIGEVDDIIVSPGTGQPVAVISVGGFLGIGARLVAIPYERLQYNAERERWTLQGATKDSLQALPAYDYDDNRRG
jgi:sporulation protein YlmC with PRC-barrel domain